MNDGPALLLPLFTVLRRFLPLGTGDYLLAVQTLRAAVGIETLDDIRFTCRLLWAKSLEDQEIFDREFDRLVRPVLQQNSYDKGDETDDIEMATVAQDMTLAPEERRGHIPTLQSTHGREGKLPIAIRPGVSASEGGPQSRSLYQLHPRLPLTRRDLAAIWRHLRRLQRDGVAVELDVEGTIDHLCQHGFFLRPVMQARRSNQVHLFLVIDVSPSMIPFTYLIEALVESMYLGGLRDRVQIVRIGNNPNLATKQADLKIMLPMPRILRELPKETSVVIVSDAGAARGAYRTTRVEATRTFLTVLSQYVYRYAWLNPLPRSRWEASSAEDISSMVPMYTFTRNDLLDAVGVLRGRPFPSEVRLRD